MKLLNYNQNDFCVAHFQGKSYTCRMNMVENLMRVPIKLPANIEIVTVSNNPSDAMLIKQLSQNQIPFINKAEIGGSWYNTKKIGYILEALQDVKSEYVLILDADDVLLTNSIPEIIVRFIDYGKKILYGATKNNFPYMLIDKIYNRDFRGDFRYFNAGTCIGYKDYCIKFYEKAAKILSENIIYNPANSEQLIIRHVFKDHTNEIDFDYKCNIFQTLGNTLSKEVGNNKIMIL